MKRYPLYNSFAYAFLEATDRLLHVFLKKRDQKIPIPSKLLLCNGAHLGDVILTTALLPVIKASYPQIKIGMLVGSWSRSVIEDHPLVDQIHSVDHWKLNRGGKKNYWKSRQIALQELREARYDAAIDCPFHFPNCAPLLWQAKIPIRVGFESAGLSPFLTHTLPWRADANTSAVHAYFSLLTLFPHIETEPELIPHLPLSAHKKEPYLVLHMGRSNTKKQWPFSQWLALTQKLLEENNTLYFTGKGREEHAAIEQMRTQCPQIHNLCDRLDWKDFAQLIQKASLLIATDTSAGHIAAATCTPAILLFSGIHPPNLWRPPGAHIHVLTHPVPCSPCFTGCKTPHCLTLISPNSVYEQATKILALR